MHWMTENTEHPILIPLMNPSAAAFQACAIYVMTHPFVKLPTVVLLSSFFFMMCKSTRYLCVFATCSFKQISPCNLLLSSLDLFRLFLFFSFFLLRSCIVVSSSWAVQASRVSHKHYRQAHFSQVDSPAILQDVSRQTADMWQIHVAPVSLH